MADNYLENQYENYLARKAAMGKKTTKKKNIIKVERLQSEAIDALKDIIYPEAPKEVTPDLILNIVAEHFGVTVADIKSSKRNSELVLPRQIFMFLCREMIDIPLTSIASILGKKDPKCTDLCKRGLVFGILGTVLGLVLYFVYIFAFALGTM